ncbi:hypothetical protein [Endozoicomonas sp. GU-1]|uniref:hypothetical protein n=1 Tax=Endozoicomonas sp. GU-1 TaxID=3009078 RepID=UPI0022B3FF16|nr:hypothetical protein [Endozoicomonas sp. GU-1]WBA83034.1 hypothetical protein O2T12_07900 [Endozoicomonas sp. GU-1]WBA85957.1 hypothetical protein O3276_22535 [Endozoicomonas sp. GU-1]
MIKRYGSPIFAALMFFSIPLLYGCKSQLHLQTMMEKEKARSTQQIADTIAKINEKENALPISKNMYRRQLSINFTQEELAVNSQHKQVINLFFNSLPKSQQLNIIISVAPSSAEHPFKTLNDSWSRLQSLKNILEQYSEKIELVYQPELGFDSATIHVVGNDISGGSGVQ